MRTLVRAGSATNTVEIVVIALCDRFSVRRLTSTAHGAATLAAVAAPVDGVNEARRLCDRSSLRRATVVRTVAGMAVSLDAVRERLPVLPAMLTFDAMSSLERFFSGILPAGGAAAKGHAESLTHSDVLLTQGQRSSGHSHSRQ